MKILLAALALVSSLAAAQDYPARPLRIIVPWPAGGTVDGLIRALGPRLTEGLGQPVIVENKAGASGSLGAAEVAKATPDGYTLLAVFDTHATNHHLIKSLPYDGYRAFEHVTQIASTPQAFVGAANFAPGSVAELVAYARSNPGKVNYATVGSGSSNHLNMVLFMSRTGTEMQQIPYKGGAPAMTDLLGGQVQVMIVSAWQTIPHIKSGKLKGLAVGSLQRMPQLPEVPAFAETLPGFEAVSWTGVVAPARTPAPIVARLHREIVKALAASEVREKLTGQGFEIVGSSPQAFAAFVAAESDKWGKVIREYGIRAD
ncbi:MAG TPA: tripartite tricarboxylate transporter substrate binding protein [Burkholderiales bacterium]|nr:tripartite tricarboxylate transporter substrate binding protein [Burkholderiales bacterium]